MLNSDCRTYSLVKRHRSSLL